MDTSKLNFIDDLSAEHKELLAGALLHNDWIGINITDNKGKILFLNDAHTRITGHPKSLYMNTTMYELEKNGSVNTSAVVRVLASGKTENVRQTASNGRSFEVRGIPIRDTSGKICLVLCLLTDITDVLRTQEKYTEMEEYANILKQAIGNENRMVYQSDTMTRIVEKSKRIAETDVSVLITGPSGVGKELIADIIHENSPRKNKPFVKINCAAIPEQLLESELFGYEPGAFTGGSPKGKKGLIESAHGGSLLLDEIGELPMLLQSKLLRALQERTIRRLGGNKAISVDFRLISSTNVDLKEKIAEKEFREDLYYRLNVIEINVPSLDNRKEDIPLLINHFIKVFCVKYDLKKSIESDALKFLCQYSYPGNVRELRNIVERLVIQSPGNYISAKDAYESIGIFKEENNLPAAVPQLLEDLEGLSLKDIMEQHEKALLQEYIKIYKNGTELSKVLKTNQSTISRKLAKYNISY